MAMVKLLQLPVMIALLAISISFATPAQGQERTRLPTYPHAAISLDHMFIEMRGTTHTVKSGETLTVIAGDRFLIRDVVLNQPQLRPQRINVYGFIPADPKQNDDRGSIIYTRDLQKKYALDKQGTMFAVLVTTAGRLHGTVYVRIVPPQLSHVVLSVNGKQVTLRPDDPPKMFQVNDAIKMESVAANFSTDGDEVVVRFVKEAAQPRTGIARWTLELKRSGVVFARIPMQVQTP